MKRKCHRNPAEIAGHTASRNQLVGVFLNWLVTSYIDQLAGCLVGRLIYSFSYPLSFTSRRNADFLSET
uniref:Uncharacterized protein n=1 Tax=Romanomermis culicivorax TaxID=13658 RepID=A0A915KAI0_ROMCU